MSSNAGDMSQGEAAILAARRTLRRLAHKAPSDEALALLAQADGGDGLWQDWLAASEGEWRAEQTCGDVDLLEIGLWAEWRDTASESSAPGPAQWSGQHSWTDRRRVEPEGREGCLLLGRIDDGVLCTIAELEIWPGLTRHLDPAFPLWTGLVWRTRRGVIVAKALLQARATTTGYGVRQVLLTPIHAPAATVAAVARTGFLAHFQSLWLAELAGPGH